MLLITGELCVKGNVTENQYSTWLELQLDIHTVVKLVAVHRLWMYAGTQSSSRVKAGEEGKLEVGMNTLHPLWTLHGTLAQPHRVTRLLNDILLLQNIDKKTEDLVQKSLKDIRPKAIDYHYIGFSLSVSYV